MNFAQHSLESVEEFISAHLFASEPHCPHTTWNPCCVQCARKAFSLAVELETQNRIRISAESNEIHQSAITPALIERFWSKVDKTSGLGPNGDCWIWTGYIQKKRKKNYGTFTISTGKARLHRAHRVSWQIIYGPIPQGMVVMHTCDHPPCVRPEHLKAVTQLENMRDMTLKGRRKGVKLKQRLPKMTRDQVAEIRTSTETNAFLAKKFGVGVGTVRDARKGRTWKTI